MERRKFFERAAGIGIPVVGLSVFGDSAAQKSGAMALPMDGVLHLPLTHSNVPPGLRDVAARISDFAATLANNAECRDKFTKDPKAALSAFGLNGILSKDTGTISALQIALDTSLVDAAKRGYQVLLSEMRKKGHLKPVSKNLLKKYFLDVLRDNKAAFSTYLDQTTRSALAAQSLPSLKGNRLSNLVELAAPRLLKGTDNSYEDETCDYNPDECYGVAAAVSFVWIAVVAYTYVVVAATFGVAITAVAYISVGCEMGVAGCVNGSSVTDMTAKTDQSKVNAAMQNIANINNAAIVAHLSGKPGIARQALIDGIYRETEAVIAAAEQLRLIDIPPSKRTAVLSELKLLVTESLGVD
jgi:hypothetical protein